MDDALLVALIPASVGVMLIAGSLVMPSATAASVGTTLVLLGIAVAFMGFAESR